MNIHRWQSRVLRIATISRLMVLFWLIPCVTGIPESAQAQTVCTLVVHYTGQLWHNQLGVPASYVEFDRIGGYCEGPFQSMRRLTTDIDGRYTWTSIQPFQPAPDGWFNVGDHIVFDIRPRQQARVCEVVLSWDGTAQDCVPADSQKDGFSLRRVDIDRGTGPPTIPSPENLYTPYYYDPVSAYVFAWSPVLNANRYIMRIDTSDAPIETAHPWRLIGRSTAEAIVPDLPPAFTWRVRAMNGCSLSVWSSPTIYAAIDEVTNGSPSTFNLSQNYPNPFNASTVIRFDLDVVSDWSLTIHNILGQTIRRYEGSQSEGSQLVEWYGDDGIGNPMPSGIYFYRVETSRWSESRKMILLR